MAKHRRRREMATSKQSDYYNDQPPRRNLKVSGIVAGITLCSIFAVYFAFSAPSSRENVPKTVNSNENWHLDKETWSLEPLSDKEFELVSDAVHIERFKNEYLRNFMHVRTPGSENIKKVKNFIVSTLQSLNYDVDEDTFKDNPPASYSKNPVTFTNVIATRNPLAKRRLVLACHYDSKVTPKGFLGATDSAVPCAMLLEIAKALDTYLSLSPKDSDITLQLIFFDGEEAFVQWSSYDSIYGARHLARKWQDETWPPDSDGQTNMLDSIDLFVLLDLLGEENPTFYDLIGVHKTGHYKDLMRIEKWVQNGEYRFFNERRVNSRIEDDHIPFLKRNVPILHVIPQPFPKNWHKITDNGENLHDPTIEKLTKIFAVFTAEYLHLKPIAF